MPKAKGEAIPGRQAVKDAEFPELFARHGAAGIARMLNLDIRRVYKRRREVEKRLGVALSPPTRTSGGHVQQLDQHPGAIQLGLQDGFVLIGSDSHYHPGIVSTAHRAFVEFAKEYKPKVIVKNGDEFDFSSISRHAPIGWEKRPTVAEEIENTGAMLSEIEKAAPNARRIWPLGNHDSRFETRIATIAPEYAKVNGVHLKDHFPKWESCWAALINDNTVIKHRFKSGVHAPHNNSLWAGRSIITGHLHSLKVMPISDFNGTRWGVDCGMMADPYGPQFYNWTELNPVNWRSGFVFLTVRKGRILWPEVVWVSGPNTIQFRGREWSV